MNEACNGIAHDDATRMAKLRVCGWSVTLADIRRVTRDYLPITTTYPLEAVEVASAA